MFKSLQAQKIIGYIPQYRTTAQMDASIEWDKMTDYYYFGSQPTTSGGITLEQPTRFDHVKAKAITYQKNIWLSCGGWNKSSAFITIANDSVLSQDFADEALSLCNTHGLTGVDIDWEFPAYGQETAFKNFFKILYQTLNPAGFKVSAAAGGEAAHADKWQADLFNYIDDLNIMSYDAGVAYSNHASLQFMEDAMDLYYAQGCPYEKMLGGVAFYSRCSGVLMYSTILNGVGSSNPQTTYENDLTGGYCYNGRNTIEDKIDYVMGKGGIGVLVWEVTQDAPGQYSLLNACDEAMDKHRCSAPTPALGNDQSICGLSSIALNGSVAQQSGVTFTWKKGTTTLVNNSATANTYSVSSSGAYTLEVWQNGCNRSDEIEITGVLTPPSLGGPFELCDPSSVVIDAGDSGIGRTIEWQLDNQTITGETSSTIVARKEGIFKIIVSATGCSSVNATASVTSDVPYADADTICSSGDDANLVASEIVAWYGSESSPTILTTSQVYTPTVNSNTTYWMGGAGNAQQSYTTLKPSYNGGWGAGTGNYGTKIEVLSDLNIDAITVSPVTQGTLKMNLKTSDGSTISQTMSIAVSEGEQEVQLNWDNITPGVYYIDAVGSTMNLIIDGNLAPSDFLIEGIISSDKNGYENWGGGYSASTNYGFFINLKITAGKECARVPVDIVIDSGNNKCLTVNSNEILLSKTMIYPNPSSTNFTITNTTGVLVIYDINGKLIEKLKLNGAQALFGDALEKGVYFVQISSSKQSITRKIVKK
jgi:hypothetical protein